jgi:arylformamidase
MDADTAYANAPFIPGGEAYRGRWQAQAAAFRAAHPPEVLWHGPSPRQVVHLFRPEMPKGLVVFVHGGYWIDTAPDLWSHLAAGPLARGWAVALAGYDLCPSVSLPQIREQVVRAIEVAAGAVPGPVHLAGHSAGGHLVARIACADVPLAVRSRVGRVVPISPLADLGPLMATSMNAKLRIDAVIALEESPLRRPAPPHPVTVWVGGAERPAFLWQACALADRWGCGLVVDEGRHHFDVIEGLERADSPLCAALLGD